MFEKFTPRGRKVMSLAREEALRQHSEFIDTEHILLGIMQAGRGVAVQVLEKLSVEVERVQQEVEKLMTPSNVPSPTLGMLLFSPRARRMIELAGLAASQRGDDIIGTQHYLLGLLMENEGIAGRVLTNVGLELERVRSMVTEVLDAEGN